GRAFVERRTIEHVNHDWSIPDEFPDMNVVTGLGPCAMVATPLLRESEPVGVLQVIRLRPESLTQPQIALLETFADQALIAIENARLFGELQDRVRELQALGDVGQAVSSSLDLQEVLTTILVHAVRLSGAEGGVVFEVDHDSGTLRVSAAHGLNAP